MPNPKSSKSSPPQDMGLAQFEEPPSELGLSLEELSEAYAALIEGGDDPYQAVPESPDELGRVVSEIGPGPIEVAVPSAAESEVPADDVCDISPSSILEAMLFVGHPVNQPLESRHIASLMRGVMPEEIDELVKQLNQTYLDHGCPYQIKSVGSGYRLGLRPEMEGLADRFFGRLREARLSQAAIDILAIVAYNQPISREEIEQLRGHPSSGVLAHLVRRELLQLERSAEDRRHQVYRTTTRFLEAFGLASVEDLPRSQDLDRTL